MVSTARLAKIFDGLVYVLFAASVVALPLFSDNRLVNAFVLPKQYVLIGLIVLMLLAVLGRTLLSRTLRFRRSALDWLLLVIVGAGLISASFSVDSRLSFFGRNDYFIFNFVWLLFLAVYYFIGLSCLNTARRWQGVYYAAVITGGVSAATFIVKTLWHPALLNSLMPASNSVEPANGLFGVWLVVTFILAAGLPIKKQISKSAAWIGVAVSLLVLAALLLLSFKLLWWLMLAALLLLLVLGVSFIHQARLSWLSTLFSLLILTIIFLLFDTPRSLQQVFPVEVYLSPQPSWSISTAALFNSPKNFVFGSGLGTFGIDFSAFRTLDFNADPTAWPLRFTQPYSTLFGFIGEGGIVILLGFALVSLINIGYFFGSWAKVKQQGVLDRQVPGAQTGTVEHGWEVLLAGCAFIVLTIAMALVFFGPVLWWAWWLLLSLSITGFATSHERLVSARHFTLENTPQYNLASVFTMIVLMAGLLLLGVWGGRVYAAEALYTRALRSSDPKEATGILQKAIRYRGSVDVYYTALAQSFLQQASVLSRQPKPDVQAASALLAEAVNAARRATEVSPRSVAIWENLAQMYDNAAVLVPEAREWVVKSLQEASALEPTNPVIKLRLGNTLRAQKKLDEAIKAYEEAVKLKNDFIDAQVALADAYEAAKKDDQAVEVYKAVLLTNANNAQLLFNYGRVLYNRNNSGDRALAETIWKQAVQIQPQFSNALYGLGLLYETKGDTALALQYYYRVKNLNPDNPDLGKKIKALLGNK